MIVVFILHLGVIQIGVLCGHKNGACIDSTQTPRLPEKGRKKERVLNMPFLNEKNHICIRSP